MTEGVYEYTTGVRILVLEVVYSNVEPSDKHKGSDGRMAMRRAMSADSTLGLSRILDHAANIEASPRH